MHQMYVSFSSHMEEDPITMHGVGVHLNVRGRKYIRCIFSMYGVHLNVTYVLFTVGKDSLQSIVLSLCAYSHDGCGSISIWERENMHGVFFPCMEPTWVSCMCSLLLGKTPSIHYFVLMSLLTWRLWGPPSYEREEICTVYFLHIWSPFSFMYSLLLGKIPFNLSFCICMFYSHCICMWLLFLNFLLKIRTLILIFYTLQVLIFMEWLLHQRYAVVHVTSLLSQKRFFFFFGWESTKKSRS